MTEDVYVELWLGKPDFNMNVPGLKYVQTFYKLKHLYNYIHIHAIYIYVYIW